MGVLVLTCTSRMAVHCCRCEIPISESSDSTYRQVSLAPDSELILTPLRLSSWQGLPLSYPDRVRQLLSKSPVWWLRCQVAKFLVAGLLGLPPAQPLSCELAHPFCSLQRFARDHGAWSS